MTLSGLEKMDNMRAMRSTKTPVRGSPETHDVHVRQDPRSEEIRDLQSKCATLEYELERLQLERAMNKHTTVTGAADVPS